MKTYKKYFIDSIRHPFPEILKNIVTIIDHHYCTISKDIAFSITSLNPIDKSLDFCAYFLALIISSNKLKLSYELISPNIKPQKNEIIYN